MKSEISNLKSKKRRICYVTGTRAEFGLMERTLRAIQAHRRLELQLIVTGMHLDKRHGRTINQIRKAGWNIEAVVPWRPTSTDLAALAEQTGQATAHLARAFERLKSDIVLVVGDRVEAFGAASAAHLSGRIVAHVHGGDRAQGQVDDTLRHAITKLAHIHFPATEESARRILKLGEDSWRVHVVGSPGLDGIQEDALPVLTPASRRRYALMLLHPTSSDERAEYRRARMLLQASRKAGLEEIIAIAPNNDPGAAGIARCWQDHSHDLGSLEPNWNRPAFLGLLRDAAVLVGNSSSGIIEAASFGTPVLDVGDRQKGRLRGQNVTTVPFRQGAIKAALQKVWNGGRPLTYSANNPYGRGDTAGRIARILATIRLNERLRQKLIAY